MPTELPAESTATTEPAPAPSEIVESEATPAANANNGEMVVTGSRIRRTSFAQPSAVSIVSREELQKSGAQTFGDVVKYMTINSGSDINTGVSTNSGSTMSFNLRGLGVNSTLVLLNGRRVVQSAAASTDGDNFVDITSIPIAAIERIEVLKGGASAIYGSDAVAGVVNIITRKNYNGFEVQLGGQSTDRLDQGEWDLSLLGGASNESTRAVGMLSLFNRSELGAADRAFTNNHGNVSNLGWPSAFLKLDPTGKPLLDANNKPIGYRDPGCGTVPLSAPTMDPNAPVPFCTFDFNSYFYLVVPEQRLNSHVSVEHDINKHAMLFFETSYARDRSHRHLSPAFPLLQPVIVPADNMYNPTGSALRWYGRAAGGNSPPYDQSFDSDTITASAGVKGDLGGIGTGTRLDDWEWQLAGTWSMNRFDFTTPDMLKGPLQTALNSCKPGDDPANCWNPFSFGPPNSQQIIDRVTGSLRSRADSQLLTGGLDINGPLFALPGGDLQIALGAQLRREATVVANDHDANQFAYAFLIGGPDYQAKREIAAGYGELSAPFFKGFELQAAARAEHYSDVGSTVNPMAGASWTPATTFLGDAASLLSKVRLRGTVARSFRAPSLLQAYGYQTELQPINNVTADMNGNAVVAANQTFLAVRTQGNPDLKPQTATTFTLGAEWSPISGLFLQTDYWNYKYDDIIVKENAQQLVAADFADRNNPQVHRGVGSIPEQVDVRFINATSVLTHGIDLEASYRAKLGAQAGALSFGGSTSYVFAYYIPRGQVALAGTPNVSCNQTRCDVAGSRNFANFAKPLPRLRFNVPVSWTLGAHTATVIGHFISGYKDDQNPDPMTKALPDISPWFTLDLQYQFRLHETNKLATTFKVGITNVFDTLPPSVRTGFGYDTYIHDPRGRMIYGRLIQEL